MTVIMNFKYTILNFEALSVNFLILISVKWTLSQPLWSMNSHKPTY